MRLRHPCSLPLLVWQSEIAIDNRDRIRPNRLNPIMLLWQSQWNWRFDRIIGNTGVGYLLEIGRDGGLSVLIDYVYFRLYFI